MHMHGSSNKIHDINYKFSMLLFKNRITKTIAVSEYGSFKIKQLVGNIPTEIISNGVNTDFYNPNLPVTYKKGSPELLFVSGLRKYKNSKLLITMMSKLLQRFPDAHLQIVGDGDELETLKNLVKNKKLETKVELTGKIINPEELRLRYSSCDLYISASSLEACPVSPFEAMSCGKPLVLYGIEPHEEIIDASHAGLTFNSLNEEEICKKIQEVYENKISFGRHGRDFANKHSWLNVAKQMISLYDKIL